MNKLSKILILLLSFSIIFFKVNLKIEAQQPKEIENYISNVLVWDIGNGREAGKDGFGNY